MAGNTFGQLFRVTTFGESHGPGLGGVVDGCPAGLELDVGSIQQELTRRRPGQSKIVSQRKENDTVEFLSGLFEGKTTGAPLGFIVRNEDHKPGDYDHLKETFRPSHADYTYEAKYGHRDHRGGGRSSARETVCRVVAGGIAKQILANIGVKLHAFVSQVGEERLNKCHEELNLEKIESNPVRCPDEKSAEKMLLLIEKAKGKGDTIGGKITGLALQVPPGWGEPVFDKLHADLGKAMLSIPAVKGFSYGFGGVDIASSRGSEVNDVFKMKEGEITTQTNYSGGIQGGISNGADIYFEVSFKPVATIMQSQLSVDKKGNTVEIKGKGRHDPCVVPRAVPIVEAMTALVLADHYLRSKTSTI